MGTLIIIGAGGLGREVWSIAVSHGLPPEQVSFLSDPAPPQDSPCLKFFGGPVENLAKTPEDSEFVIAVGDNNARARIDQWARAGHRTPRSLIARDTHIGMRVDIGPGCIVLPHSSMTTDVNLGRCVIINPGVRLSHDCKVGDYCLLGPGVALAGGAMVGAGCTIGTNATILPGVHIGDGATVGSGACVTRDVQPGATVVGIPARPIAGNDSKSSF